MIILGSGTKLERTDSDDTQWSIPANTLTIESISNTGVSTAIPWQKNINFAATPFYITEMNIITLGETDNIKIIGWSSKYMPRIMDGQTISHTPCRPSHRPASRCSCPDREPADAPPAGCRWKDSSENDCHSRCFRWHPTAFAEHRSAMHSPLP